MSVPDQCPRSAQTAAPATSGSAAPPTSVGGPIPRPANDNGGGGGNFRASFTHWRSGKVYYAKDYGHKGWPFGG